MASLFRRNILCSIEGLKNLIDVRLFPQFISLKWIHQKR